MSGVGDGGCGGAAGVECATVVRESLTDAGSGLPLDGACAAGAVELDVISTGDGSDGGCGARLVGGAGLPGLPSALSADADLAVNRVAHGRSDGGLDLPFAGLEHGVGRLSLRRREQDEENRCGQANFQKLHIGVQINTAGTGWEMSKGNGSVVSGAGLKTANVRGPGLAMIESPPYF